MYSKLVLSRALRETRLFWTVHRNWVTFSGPIGGYVIHASTQGWGVHFQVRELGVLVLEVVLGYGLSWLGTFLINIVRSPGLLQRELQVNLDVARGDTTALREALAQERESLDGCPHVQLSVGAGGIDDLHVESATEAINVRLVQAQSEHYYLRSEIIRYLRAHSPETLVVHCYPKQHERGGPLSRGFTEPSVFFMDQYPTYEGHDMLGAVEQAMTFLTERQLVVPLEVAYSDVSRSRHYRSSFKVRWCGLRKSIVDVEPIGIRRDADPPPAAPPEVIADHSRHPALQFQEWHSGKAWNFPSRYGGGNPTWIAIKNTPAASAEQATNVTARLEFVDSAGKTRWVVPQATWYHVERFGRSGAAQRWVTEAGIDAGDGQSFVLFVTNDRGCPVVYKNAAEPIGQLDYGHWQVKIIITSDNGDGFEGEIGFTYTSSGLTPDRPAFTHLRTLRALVKSAR